MNYEFLSLRPKLDLGSTRNPQLLIVNCKS